MIKTITVLCLAAAAVLVGCQNDESTVVSSNSNTNTNHPPNSPSNPVPADYATGVPRFVTLSWQCSDPNAGDTLRYDVYWGQNENTSSVLVLNTLVTSIDLGLVASHVTIFWRVVAKDNHGAYTNGPVWRFTTEQN